MNMTGAGVSMKRYEALAEEMSDLIRNGVLQPGNRLPSVRQTSASRRVSPSTVFEAYYLLEARGLVVSRPRSGYFVKLRRERARAELETSIPSEQTQQVVVSDLVFQVLGHTREHDLVPLGSAFPSPGLFPLEKLSRSLARAVRRLDPRRTVLDLSPGSETLRRQIALRYLSQGGAIDTAEIVITNGAMEALNLCLEAVSEPGDLVAIESPTFYAALQALERRRLRAVEVASHPRTGVDLASLASVLDRHPVKACWFMTNFQNPLGSLMPEGQKRALVELLAARGIPLIEDDVYAELYFGVRKPLPAKAFDKHGLVLHCSSFSKSLAPGYRIGWTAAGRYALDVARRMLSSSLGAAIPSQEGVSDYLQHGGYDRHLRGLRASLRKNQEGALRAIEKHFPNGTRVTQPEGGYFLWVELPASIDALHLHRLALSYDISLAPGHLFSADQRYSNFLRINYGHPDDTRTEHALETVGRLAKAALTGSARPLKVRA